MAFRIQFMQEVAGKVGLQPVKKWSQDLLNKLPPEMSSYLSGLRRANKFNPKETVVRLHMGEFDNNLFIAANASNNRVHVCNFIEQGRSDMKFDLEGLRHAINNTARNFKTYI